ncbi:citrate lyase subunit beta / citryl-CoA lyase [Paraburkholderia lycopersici]|uniref:Citrate lyase subunit beta / citryl-CoA lyase n=2 Tax=Paraburkholderia lycopersici TaxID=416944 RepID=A0A1G6X8E1_9BURK|nr:citrate lyase subunit beta / citryl-CoA lyase [Paraburkholderia lycopersici]
MGKSLSPFLSSFTFHSIAMSNSPSDTHDEPRSWLFVPGDRPDRFDKALAAGADAVIVDLEDAVASQDKTRARDAVATWLDTGAAGGRRAVYVRINGAETAWFADDVGAFAAHPEVRGIMLPKAADTSALGAVQARARAGLHLVPLLESAAAFAAIHEIASAPGVERLAFGTVDFQVDTGIGGDGEELSYFRSLMTFASRVAGIGSAVDGVTTTIDDAEAIEAAARRARRFGFGGRLCIHPRQIAPTHRGFAPAMEERVWAQRVIDAADASSGSATVLDGKMIDAPVIQRARLILAAAR